MSSRPYLLYGTNLTRKGSPVERAVDEATGRFESDVERLIWFVHEFVYTRVERWA